MDKYVSTTLIDEMVELKKNLAVMSENNMQEALNNLSDAEKEVLLRLYVEGSRKWKLKQKRPMLDQVKQIVMENIVFCLQNVGAVGILQILIHCTGMDVYARSVER